MWHFMFSGEPVFIPPEAQCLCEVYSICQPSPNSSSQAAAAAAAAAVAPALRVPPPRQRRVVAVVVRELEDVGWLAELANSSSSSDGGGSGSGSLGVELYQASLVGAPAGWLASWRGCGRGSECQRRSSMPACASACASASLLLVAVLGPACPLQVAAVDAGQFLIPAKLDSSPNATSTSMELSPNSTTTVGRWVTLPAPAWALAAPTPAPAPAMFSREGGAGRRRRRSGAQAAGEGAGGPPAVVVVVPDVSPLPLHVVPAKGKEVLAYLTAILTHYDDLDETSMMAFTHGSRLGSTPAELDGAWGLEQDWALRRLAALPPTNLTYASLQCRGGGGACLVTAPACPTALRCLPHQRACLTTGRCLGVMPGATTGEGGPPSAPTLSKLVPAAAVKPASGSADGQLFGLCRQKAARKLPNS